jgi:hypothetical protein
MSRRLRLAIAIAFAVLCVGLLAAEVGARGRGGGGRPNVSRGGPASHGSMRGGHSPGRSRNDRADNRRDHASERREVRRDVRSERREVRRDVRSERHEWYEDRWKRRVGARLTHATYRTLSCSSTIVVIDGVAYHRCGPNWYRRYVHGGSVTYVVVVAPQ